MTQRRSVHVSSLVPRAKKGGAHVKVWGYTYADIAAIVGKSESAVRRDACARRDPRTGTIKPPKFNPADLRSVLAYISSRSPRTM